MLIDVAREHSGKLIVNGTKKVLTPLINDRDFKRFLENTTNALNVIMITFIEANGYDIKQLEEERSDLDQLFQDNEYYNDFIIKYLAVKQSIETAQYIGENVIYMKRKLHKDIAELQNFIKAHYPEYKPKHRIVNIKSFIWNSIKKLFFVASILILAGFAYIFVSQMLR